MNEQNEAVQMRRTVRVWDVPVRLFHWALVILIAVSFVTAQIGGNAMAIHQLSGQTILALVLFRILWGFAGSTNARFSGFVRGFAEARSYAAILWSGRSAFYTGHNPLGGWMIVLMLLSLLVQAGTGLFANDDIMIEGPLAEHVSEETSDLLTQIHETNFYVLAALMILHVCAALYYLWRKRENLILPMFTGSKPLPQDVIAEDFKGGSLWLAAVLLAACVGAVVLLVR